ncbi:unnamed protein product [Clonostachys rhizophaga]|uniref:Uncharacterized protein n=1 Tax=Clonostachys rhizophaga TaxID=160324 RepID=A0A9N9YTV9_9HYPO|nr:unnamed protein product [Clonostachys rhizophaga]
MTGQTKHMVSIEKRTMSHEEVEDILRPMTPRPEIETSDHFWYIVSSEPFLFPVTLLSGAIYKIPSVEIPK